MFTMSSLCPTLGWEYPIEYGKDQHYLPNNISLDPVFLFDFQNNGEQELFDHVKQSESPQGTSSTDPFDDPTLAKKLNHNASERLRRKKISNLYSSLRDLLPPNDHKKKLSVPGTVVRMVEYIPELQQEVEGLIRKKEDLIAKVSALHGNAGEFIIEEKPKQCIIKETTSCSISTNKLGDKEMVIQLSTFERISLCEVILQLQKDGYLVIDVSSFQSFGGRTFYNIHLWMEGSYVINFDILNETLLSVIQEQKQMQCIITSVAEEQPNTPRQFGLFNF